MTRRARPLLLLSLAIVGCDRAEVSSKSDAVSTEASIDVAPAAAPLGLMGGATDGSNAPQAQAGESYTYDHNLTVSMASDFIKARFERARDRCQNDPGLKCKVTMASYRVLGEPNAPLPVANLSVSLPHDSVVAFEDSLLALLPDESKDDVVVKSRQTNAQNVTNQVRDIAARLSQLSNYRDRMADLAKRRNASTDDLIKIEAEISRTQSEIEQIEAQRRDLADRIAKENLTISFEAQSTVGDAFQPVSDVWQSSLRLMAESAASALGFVIGIVPWIPVFLLGYFLFRFVWRRTRKPSA